MSAQEITVPDIGDFSDIPVIEIHVAAGDTVAAEDPLVTLESDKATLDVPAPVAGTVITEIPELPRRPPRRAPSSRRGARSTA